MNEQQYVGETVTEDAQDTLGAVGAWQAKHRAADNARRAMDAAWSHYCTVKRQWERLDREAADAFEPIWNRRA